MPRVLYFKGYEFFFYSNEGSEPMHIHVGKAEAIGKIWLEPKIEVSYMYGFSSREIKEIQTIVNERVVYLKVSGMNIFKNNKNISSNDQIDVLIYEKGLRIRTLYIEKELDLFLIILSNGNLIKSRISSFKKLAEADQEELLKWELKNGGIAVRWEKLDEDLSLYGFIKEATFNSKIDQIMNKNPFTVVA